MYTPSPGTAFAVDPSSNVGMTVLSTSPLNTGVPSWGVFLGPSDSASFVVVCANTVGVYFADTSVPFLSTRFTITPDASPTKFGSGVNVTTPVLPSIVYVPSFGTTTFPSLSAPSNVAGTSVLISTVLSTPLTLAVPPMNFGVPVWGVFLGPTEVTSSPVGMTSTTVGVYFAVIGVPFLSTRWTSTPSPTPVNCGSGWNFTLPSSIVYVPSPGITTGSSVGSPVSGLISLGTLVSSISTVFSTPLIVIFPPLNSGNPVWATPWISLDFAGVAVGVTPFTRGV